MTLITLHSDNLRSESIPCVDLKNPNNRDLFMYNQTWLQDRFEEGLVIIKMDSPREAFLEFIPAEKAWKPISAPGYIFINHIFVEHPDPDHWIKSELLQQCETENSDTNGMLIMLDREEFQRDKDFYIQRGYLEHAHLLGLVLLVKKFKIQAPSPYFTQPVELIDEIPAHDITIKYADQSEFSNYYMYIMKKDFEDLGFKVRLIKLNNAREARESGSPYGTFGVFMDGHFLTHKLLNQNAIEALIGNLDLDEMYPEFSTLNSRELTAD